MADMIPFMRLYPSDYYRDTGHLSTVQHGAYLLLLMEYWNRRGPLPDDDHKLSRFARLSIREWRKHRADLEPYFVVQGGTWTQNRVERELALVRAKSLKAREAGRASVAAKQNRRSNERDNNSTNHDKMSDAKSVSSPPNGEEENTSPPTGGVAPEVAGDGKAPKPKPYSERFEQWWAEYPNREGKAAAAKAWAAAIPRIMADKAVSRIEATDHLLAATRAYAQLVSGKEKRFIPYPQKWLNEGRYDGDAVLKRMGVSTPAKPIDPRAPDPADQSWVNPNVRALKDG